MRWLLRAISPTDRVLAGFVLAPITAVVTYASVVSIDASANAARMQVAQNANLAAADDELTLKYADADKALFHSQMGLRLVMVGSSLEPAGHVASIAMEDGHWTVRTTKGVTFVEQD
jgi:hypothetical protein